MKDYINGCYTKYGTRSMNIMEIMHRYEFENGLGCRIGYIPTKEDGVSIDLMKNGEIIAWEHGMKGNISVENLKNKSAADFLVQLAINRFKEMNLM